MANLSPGSDAAATTSAWKEARQLVRLFSRKTQLNDERIRARQVPATDSVSTTAAAACGASVVGVDVSAPTLTECSVRIGASFATMG